MLKIFSSLALTLAIIVTTFNLSKLPLALFVNLEGLIIVFGGTVSIFLLLLPEKFASDFIFGLKVIGSRRKRREVRQTEIKELMNSILTGSGATRLLNANMKTCHEWLQLGLRSEKFETLVTDLYQNDIEKLQRLSLAFGGLAKYPPALGMIGTVFGIIGIFNGLSNESSQLSLGSNLAFAMTATLYGLVLSNFIFSPFSELIDQLVSEEQALAQLTVDAVLELSKGDSVTFISEHLSIHEK